MVVGGIALSLDAVPPIRILSVLLSLGGLTLAILEFRSKEKKEGRHFARAIAGATICGVVLLLTIIRPFWSTRGARVPQARTMSSSGQPVENVPAATTGVQESVTVAETPVLSVQTPIAIPAAIPFPCGKRLRLIPIEVEDEAPAEA